MITRDDIDELAWRLYLPPFVKCEALLTSLVFNQFPRKFIHSMYDPLAKYDAYEAQFAKVEPPLSIQEDVDGHTPPYIYTALPPNYIRLLHVQPATSSSEPIRCELAVHSVDADLPAFEALSYVWGNTAEAHWIACERGTKALRVTRNLLVALQHLRPTANERPADAAQSPPPPPLLPVSSPRALWVDAVCINQGNLAERSQQVQLMHRVYSGAWRVVVWLGPAHSDSDRALQMVRRLHAADEATKSEPQLQPQPKPRQTAPRHISPAELLELGLPPETGVDWTALDALFWRPWFVRMWVVQELAVARDAVVVCGRTSLPFACMQAAALFASRHLLGSVTPVTYDRVVALVAARINYQCGAAVTLPELLLAFRALRATEPVDKVYALLNVVPHGAGRALLRPDYTRSAAAVFVETARALLRQSLDILSQNCDPVWKRMARDLPSWTPDWSCAPRETPFSCNTHFSTWCAGGAAAAQHMRFSSSSSSDDDDQKCLILRGRLLDRVRTAGGNFFLPRSQRLQAASKAYSTAQQTRDVLSKRRQLRATERLVYGLRDYPATGEPLRTVLQKLLIADANTNADAAAATDDDDNDNNDAAAAATKLGTTEVQPPAADGGLDTPAAVGYYARRFYGHFMVATTGRRLYTTRRGYVGLGPLSTAPGDYVALFHGGKTAYILRPAKQRGTFTFIGESYLHGFMHGEGMHDEYPVQELTIV
ncbi:heterokaryon incompatibility protein [Niveomyces insectorum RCEF 264]|uniref:Heterokaryon incompatibility protein n=1 Tax=Niveomyces insectorum RCEF 264 TaxID=1081102 RepID=A0A167QVE3_9HYPO|nr:heterokaryon incompatibility protein [Niveomyces insectorum RCEF 264]